MKPFLHGKKPLEVSALRPLVPAVPGRSACNASPLLQASTAHGTPGAHVEAVKEGGKVVRLIVTCVCGERVEIECLYAGGS